MISSLPWLQAQEQQLFQLALHDHLHHALLLTGPAGIGKHVLAAQLAHLLLCLAPADDGACGRCKSCLLVKAGHHPDLLLVQAQPSIGIEQIREIGHLLQNAAQQGGARVVLLPQAHLMTEAAANALLKSLEEPGQRCYFLLQSAYAGQLMPTILSRCQRWDLSAQYGERASQWLIQQSARQVPDFLLALCGGAPLKALSLLESGAADQLQLDLTALTDFLRRGGDVQKVVAQLEKQAELPALLYYALGHTAAGSYRVIQLLADWSRNQQTVAGQNKTLALTTLLLDCVQLLR
jgi:DNA polymerase-3 subunit delta'